MSKHDGGPAFPYGQRNVTERFSEGMSLRDYFAAAALAAEWMGDHSIYEQADMAYKVADAMLAKRAKRKEAQP